MYGDPDDWCPECGTVTMFHDEGCEYVNRADCPWCLDDHDDEWSDKLCRTHEAEYEGVSEDALDRRDAIHAAEIADAIDDPDAMYRYTYPTGGIWID